MILPPRPEEIIDYIAEKYRKKIDKRGLKTILAQINYNIKTCRPIEVDRYFCDEKKIRFYYDDIEMFTKANKIPSALCFNLDEEGHDDFMDKKPQKRIVKHENTDEFYPVPRTNSRATFLGCIDAAGGAAPPLIITKRQTADIDLILYGVTPDKVMLGYNSSGFINAELFNEWLVSKFKPYVQSRRKEYNIPDSQVGMIMLDGCSAHLTETFFSICEELNLQVFILPAHSSHETQPLDLVLFHSHKSKMRETLRLDDCEGGSSSEVTKKIARVYTTWCGVCHVLNVMACFRAAGCVYEVGGPSYQYVRFTFERRRMTHKLIEDNCKGQSGKVLMKHKSETPSRVKVYEFNKLTEKIRFMKPVMEEISPGDKQYYFRKLLQMVIPVEKVQHDSPENHKPIREKKKNQENNSIEQNVEYLRLPFEEKLKCELRSLFPDEIF